MNKREIDLITALAEGNLEDETEVRALIESSDRLRAEYEAQKSAIDALASLPEVAMTESEKAALSRDLWTTLTSNEAAGTTKTSRRWSPSRWSFAVGAFAVVVVGTVVLNQQGLWGGGDSAENAALFSEMGEALESPDAAGDPPMSADPDVADSDVTMSATAADSELAWFEAATFEEGVAQFRAQPFSVEHAFSAMTGRIEERTGLAQDIEACLDEAGVVDEVPTGQMAIDGVYYIVATPTDTVIDFDSGIAEDTPVTFIDFDTCEVAHRAR